MTTNQTTTNRRSVMLAVLVCSACTALPACTSASRSSAQAFPCPSVRSVVVQPAKTTFVDVKTGTSFQPAPGRAEQVGSAMAAALAGKLNAMGVSARTGQAASGKDSLLHSRLTVHEGVGGTWDPNSGAITSTSSRIELEMQLAPGSSREPKWYQCTVLREGLDPGCRALTKLADLALKP